MSNDVANAWQAFCAASVGDTAFEPFYAATVRPAWSICRRILRHDDDAQDALQMAYARLLAIARDPEAARAVDDPAALVRRLAVREATNLRKRRGRRSFKEAAVDHIAAHPDKGRSPGEEATRREMRGRLEALISLLPERYRVPLLLYYFEGLTHEEIAQALGQKRTTITVRLQRGLKKLEPMARRAGLGSVPAALGAMAGGGAGLLDPPAALSAAAMLGAARDLAAGMTGAAALAAATGGTSAGLTGSLFAGGGAIVNTKLAVAGVAAVVILTAGIALYINQSNQSSSSTESIQSISSIAATAGNERSGEAAASKSDSESAGSTDDQPVAGSIASEDAAATTTLAGTKADEGEAAPAGHGRIAGRVVLDATGEPVAGASVAWRGKGEWGGDELKDKTGADGAFEITGLGPGSYFIMAKKGAMISDIDPESARLITLERDGEAVGPVEIRLREGRALRVRVTDAATGQTVSGAEVKLNNGTIQTTSDQGETVFTGQEAKERSVEVTASGFAKQNKTANLTVAAETLIEIALRPGGSLVGVVSDEAGQPIADVNIRDAYSGPVSFGWNTKTASDGSYRLDNLPLRTKIFGIIYEKDGYVGYWANDVELTDAATPMEYNVTLKRGLSLAGIVQNMEGQPIADATVQYGMQSNPSFRETKTVADGRFRLDTLTDKDFAKQLYVQAKGFSPKKVRVEPGSPDAPPDITVVLTKGHWIKGIVVDEAGDPRPGVYISPLGFDHHYLAGRRFSTKADGRFSFDSLPPDARFDFYGQGISEQRNVALTLDRDDVVVTILGEGWIVGRVEDEESEEPVTKFNIKIANTRGCPASSGFASIEVSRMNRGADFTSDKGLFELRDLQVGPAYMLTVEADGYPPMAFDCQQAAMKDKAEPVTLKMKKGGEALRGVVQDKDGEPIAGAEITALVYNQSNRDEVWFNWDHYKQSREMFLYYRVTTTDDEGRFEFTEVSSGRPIDILATADNYPRTRIERLEDRPREERENLVITLFPGGGISGTVDRTVYPDAVQVNLWKSSGGNFYVNKKLGADNTFEIPDLLPGVYNLSLDGNPHKTIAHNGQETTGYYSLAAKRITLEAGDAKDVKFPEGGVAAVFGQALQGDAPLANGRVALKVHTPDDIVFAVRLADTDGDGRFRFPAVESGTYTPLLWSKEPMNHLEIRARPSSDDIVVGVADLECVFEFGITGSVRGRLTGAPEGGLDLVLWPLDPGDGDIIMPRGALDQDGRFQFNSIQLGAHVLTATLRPKANPDLMWKFTLKDTIILTPEQPDVDLGDIAFPAGGSATVNFTGGAPVEGDSIDIHFFTSDALADGAAREQESVVSGYATSKEPAPTIANLPAGRVFVSATGSGFRSEPRMFPVDIVEGETASVTIPLIPMTELVFYLPGNDRIQSVALRRLDDAKELQCIADNSTQSSEDFLNVEATIFSNTRWGKATFIEPGLWTLTITNEKGRSKSETVDIQPGKPVKVMPVI